MLGQHANRRQRRTIRIIGAAAAVGLIAWIAWPSGTSQTPTRGPQNAPESAQLPTTTIPATTTSTTVGKGVPSGTKSQVSGGKLSYSDTPTTGIPKQTTPGTVGIPTTTAPTSVGSPTTVPPGATVYYGAEVNPTFVQSQTNPLKVTYGATATASIMENGQFVPTAVLPAGQLEIFSEVGQVCSLPVGGTVTSGTCSTTYASFGGHTVVANYVTGGNTYVSVILADDVQPFSTTTVAGISGGGSLGGLVFFANVTAASGNAVTTGSVSMTIADVTQGWSYVVSGAPGGSGLANDPSAWTCGVIGNYPRVGESSGCGLNGTFVLAVTPPSGDVLTETATYSGTADWSGSTASAITYAVP